MTRPPAFRSACLLSSLLALMLVVGVGCAQPPAGAVERNVVYGVADGEQLLLDVYRCSTPGPHPALMLIHGGGWRAGTKSSYAGEAAGLTRLGFVCFSVEYRFAPKFRHPAQVLDCARAVRWVRAHAADYDVDPARIGATGGSAGGHLSLMLGVIAPGDYQSEDDPNRALPGNVQCVVDLCGPTDMTGAVELPPMAVQIMRDFIGATLADAPEKYADASPITHVTKNAAPTFMIHGDKDTLVPLSQSQVMKTALDKVGVPNELVVVRNGEHGFGGGDKADLDAAIKRSLEWLKQYLLPQPPPNLH
jgi:acetyl esterase/lipase